MLWGKRKTDPQNGDVGMSRLLASKEGVGRMKGIWPGCVPFEERPREFLTMLREERKVRWEKKKKKSKRKLRAPKYIPPSIKAKLDLLPDDVRKELFGE